jgi:hypothetical protein
VWTPKRILLLVGGFALFFAAYAGYSATFFGSIDSLPPLPDADKPRLSKAGPRQPIRPPAPINAKLEKAFGVDCKEIRRPIRLDLHSKNMVLSADDFKFVDGRLQLTPISLALFGKDRGDGREPEIDTIKAKVAFLTFDRPINSPNEINGRKIIEAELIDDIQIVNNRRTPARDDDLVVTIYKGPLYYNEAKRKVWTSDRIDVKDYQSKPPINIQGTGMEMELVADTPPAKPGQVVPAGKHKTSNITGVKSIVLQADVIMHLYAVQGKGPMAAPKKDEPVRAAHKTAPAAAAVPAAPKDHIEIQTSGPFHYEFLKDYDLAKFDVPRDSLARNAPQDVTVTRYHGQAPEAPQDRLVCQHLELRMRHHEANSAQPARPGQEQDQPLEIETAHAVASNGKPVLLVSELEKLHAFGTDFFYDASKKRTTLKGEPQIEADRDDSIIFAREMRIEEVKAPPVPGHAPDETYQKVEAVGPGSIHMMNKETKKRTVHAYWNDLLTSTKDGADDLLILVGAARFEDQEHDQSLEARILKVWLLPEDKNKKPAQKPGSTVAASTPSQGSDMGRVPHHVEAYENVKSKSRELVIHDTAILKVWFKDVLSLPGNGSSAPTRPGILGAPQNTSTPGSPVPASTGAPVQLQTAKDPPARTLDIAAGPRLDPPAPAAAAQAPPERPIDLSANLVEATVLRAGDKNQLDRVFCDGTVHVRQEAAKPDEKAMDIKGDVLQMTSKPAGNELVVFSGSGVVSNNAGGDLAHLQMDKITIWGPEIHIDQAKNIAWVNGMGAMSMESKTNFQGAELERPVPLEVIWDREMLFIGDSAEFFGGIQAVQGNSRLTCQRLQVFFDQPISLKEGNHADQPARVRSLSCDANVRVEDITYDPAMVLQQYKRITGRALMMTALASEDEPRASPNGKSAEQGNKVTVTGPGDVRILQRGAVDALNGPPPRVDGRVPVQGTPVSVSKGPAQRRPAQGKQAGEETMKMTYVSFAARMDANSKTNVANFWGGGGGGIVQVLDFPTEDKDEKIDLDTILASPLPPNWMYLRCGRLRVLDRQENGRSNQQMQAFDRVRVLTRDFSAEADKVTYEEQKDLIIFFGDAHNPATLSKQSGIGVQRETLSGTKIFYRRSTRESRVEGADQINR